MKNSVQKYLSIAIGILSMNSIIAQDHFKCGLTNKLQKVYEMYPGLEADQKALLENSLRYDPLSGDREIGYKIPVVFHIIHLNGNENISDEQVFSQMEILNLDFRKLNADTAEIVPEFQAIAGDPKIEFVLANIDPFGNCTNGIEHIYSHETNNGDDYSKLNNWPRSRYLNVWVVNSMQSGVAGYAYYPSSVSTGLAYADGIIIRHNYIGNLGTSSDFTARALTHEIGHWLGLPHTWGDTNDPEVGCGDDGISDTPVTAGHTTCILTGTDNCVAGVPENVQNFMEYSYCSRMYTLGQIAVMHTTLENAISSRNNLSTEANLISTGIDDSPTLCTPLPDFYTDNQVICAGGDVNFDLSTSRAIVDTYSWYFEGGTPEYSNEISPTVNYATPGQYEVSLTVSNAAGAETITKSNFVYVMADYWVQKGIIQESFASSSFENDGWFVINPENNESLWERIEDIGVSGDGCLALQYFNNAIDPLINPHYYNRLGGTKDVVISPFYNISELSSAVLSFKYIYATTNSGIYEPTQLNLKVSYRRNCQNNWVQLENLTADELFCSGFVGTAFYPSSSDNWQYVTINLPAAAYVSNFQFRFEITAEDDMNNFFIDDINVTGLLDISENETSIQQINLHPNPINGNDAVTLTYFSVDESAVNLSLFDMLGNEIYYEQLTPIQGYNVHEILLQFLDLSSGIYNVVIEKEDFIATKKLSIK